tara:strand:+ start:1074 stop:1268 length:195 start_codon:yes stop_codon:yes gene_type:complete
MFSSIFSSLCISAIFKGVVMTIYYKGEKLSDNLTESQILLFRFLIDEGHTVDEILEMYRKPDEN